MSRYLNPNADLTSKRFFCERKYLCISLLNSLRPLDPDAQNRLHRIPDKKRHFPFSIVAHPLITFSPFPFMEKMESRNHCTTRKNGASSEKPHE
jgi:hypothetical protein